MNHSKWAPVGAMETVPELVHHPIKARMSAAELTNFERVLDAADASADASAAARKRGRIKTSPCAIGPATQVRAIQLGFEDSDDDDDVSDRGIAQALVSTIAALTAVDSPGRLGSPKEAIRWASTAIRNSRASAITSARHERFTHVLAPDQVTVAMECMSNLNALLGANQRARDQTF